MNIEALKRVALSVRCLSMDAVQKANSGHPGLPLGLADLGALLYGESLNHNPANPGWINRDRLVLSAGHGSMWLYSLLHLSGYPVSLEDIKQFRQAGSKTPGHPEYGHTEGVETTTGPLGAGFANAVGMAMAQAMMASRFNTKKHEIFNNFTYVVAGDGCLMEGLSSEASSLAGTLKLGRLIAFYDSNRITIEGSTDIAFTEDVKMRYEAYGWQVIEADAYQYDQMQNAITEAQKDTERPSLIILRSIIAYGSPTKAGSHHAHGAPLGEEDIQAFRRQEKINIDQDFFVCPKAISYMAAHSKTLEKRNEEWNKLFEEWASENPELKKAFDERFILKHSDILKKYQKPIYSIGDKIATRVAGGKALNAISALTEKLVGGSADLAPSNNSLMNAEADFTATNHGGRNLHFGVREHAMGNIVNGINLYGGLRAYGATFLVFSDYMRPTIRLAALMQLPSIFIMTHDSIYVGEDGPTHQPVEHLESLRLIPNLNVLRPADAEETNWAWAHAFSSQKHPTVLALSRQNLEVFAKPANWQEDAEKGAYVALNHEHPDCIIFATGSEVTMAIKAVTEASVAARIISVTNRRVLLEQEKSFLENIAPKGLKRYAVEAGVGGGWHQLADEVISIERFGLSGKADDVAATLHMNASYLASVLINKDKK